MISKTNRPSEHLANASQLLEQVGVTEPVELIPLPGGANSKAFRVEIGGDRPALFFKQYFHHPNDPRDRQGTEFAFARYAWDQGIRSIAQPLVASRETRCALFAFLEGRKLESQEITEDSIEQCLRFFKAVNVGKSAASHLPAGSEACFSIVDHLRCLQRRIQRLGNIVPTMLVDRHALEFIRGELAPTSIKQLRVAEESIAQLGIAADAAIVDADRCVSPSDFGFHNVLQRADGMLQFLDFEYAGWDDPAKTVCDFFCQPACPVPGRYYVEFARRIADMTSEPSQSCKRFDLLMPIYRLKWCCIMLNDFLPDGGSRRRFAIHALDEITRKTQQLQKARMALERCLDTSHVVAA